MSSTKIDPSKEDVFITHVHKEPPKEGYIIPMAYISKYNGLFIEGLSTFHIFDASDLEKMVNEGSIITIENSVKLTKGKGPFLYEGTVDPKQPHKKTALVYLADKDNPMDEKQKTFLASYTIG